MKKIHKERFIILHQHMSQPQEKLAHKKFNFYVYNSGPGAWSDLDVGTSCGTMGCMAGELPAAFPRFWAWSGNDVFLKKKSSEVIHLDLSTFFGITANEVHHLFYPNAQRSDIDPYFKSHVELNGRAKKNRVLKNLERFMIIKGIVF